ncbi:MAG TPA: 16S rRNA (adenine(1518)-N(6)/adenine(1519)-N(6))-dimethyltransferase RsmA [Candidatus Saccharimonadales bacterium]|nr:16S rRNA (adenine(1518)-N(6)/adenine(1519)-N(6))-dimethyltransferase RsmA [Candidatus Saccharimonadales bacterium]
MSHAPKKSLGQHWLFDSKSLGAICDEAEVAPEDTILEIGPGLGPLTIELTARAKHVVAVELDDRLARELPARVPAHNLTVVHSDILQFDLSQLPAGYKVVANVPYYVTSLIIRMLLESPTPPDVAVLLVQKEVAERLAAGPGDMSILAVSAQLYAEVNLGPVITADKFDPPPKVDSQVVVLRRHKRPLFADLDIKQFFRVVKAGFGEKRKTLRNSLSGGLAMSKDEASAVLSKAGIDPQMRAEALSLEQWHTLVQALRAL